MLFFIIHSKKMKRSRQLSKRIAIAISGGVDSSVAAYLLKRNHGTSKVFGLHMSNWNSSDEESQTNYCEQSEKDATDAQRVCHALGIDMQRVEFAAEYWNGVFEPFVQALVEEGHMMNPDVGCNRVVKFGVMRDYAMKRGADYIATGHYARIWHRDRRGVLDDDLYIRQNAEKEDLVRTNVADLPEQEWIFHWGYDSVSASSNSHRHRYPPPLLLAGADLSKDQSYFLCGVNGSALSNSLFPLGDLVKKNTNSSSSGSNDEDAMNTDSTGSNNNNDTRNIASERIDNIDDIDEKALYQMSVRNIAEEAKLSTALKKESMGICFIGKRKFSDFISQYLPHVPAPGNFIDIDTGEVSFSSL